MNSIITSLLTYIEVSTGAWSEEQVALDEVVTQAMDLLAYQIGQHEVTVERSDLPLVPGNSDMLKTVFYNLFSNAIKYQPKNVPGHRPTLKVWAELGEKEAQICIQDSGIGISEGYLPMLFSPFKREHQSTYEGTGLGMPICKSILEKFGGDISVAKAGPDGTTFQLTFPTYKANASQADSAQPVSAS